MSTTVGNNSNSQNFSFDLPEGMNIDSSQLPPGVNVDPTTGKVTIDLSSLMDSIAMSDFLDGQGISLEYVADMTSPQLSAPTTTTDDKSSTNQLEKLIIRQLYIEGAKQALTEQGITGEQADQILNYMVKQQGTLSDSDLALAIGIDATLTPEVQKQAGLPATWTINSTEDKNWVTDGTQISSSTVNALKINMLTDSTETYVGDMIDTVMKRIQELQGKGISNSDPQIAGLYTLLNYLKVTAEMMTRLKHSLINIQQADAEAAQKKANIKFDMVDQKNLTANEQYDKMAEAARKQKTMSDLGIGMKYAGPTIAALTTIIGVLVSVASLGTATAAGIAMIAAGITIGAAMTAYTIADSATGCSAEMTKKFTEFLDETTAGIEPEWLKDLSKTLLAIAVLAPLIVGLVAAIVSGSGAGAAASIATNASTQAAVQIGKQLVMQGVQQMLTTLLLTLLLSSDAFPDLLASIAKECGGDEDAQQGVRIFAMVLTAVAIVGTMAVAAQNAPKIAAKTDEAAEAISKAASRAGTSMSNATPEALKQAAQTTLLKTKDAIDRLTKFLEQNGPALSPERVEQMKKMISAFTRMFEGLQKPLATAEKGLRFAGPTITMVGSTLRGVVILQLAELTEELGDLESSQKLIQEMMRIIQQSIDTLLNSLGDTGETVSELGRFTSNMWNAAGRSSLKLNESTVRG